MNTKTIFFGKKVAVKYVTNQVLCQIINDKISSTKYKFNYSDEKYDVHIDYSEHSDKYRDHSDYAQHSDVI
jgi:hypothetical protein